MINWRQFNRAAQQRPHRKSKSLVVSLSALLFLSPSYGVSARPQQTGQVAAALSSADTVKTKPTTSAGNRSARYVKDGIAIDFEMAPHTPRQDGSEGVMEGENMDVRITLTDAETGAALPDLTIAAWIDHREGDGTTDWEGCRTKIEGYIQGAMRLRPAIDLNSYYILALNDGNNISVLSPFAGFGSSKLYTTVLLRSPGEDWVVNETESRLFVTMPKINAVAAVNTATWRVEKDIEVGVRPVQIGFQPDQRYLWVANDGIGAAPGGITFIDATTLEVVGNITTGAGHHEIAFGQDGRFAFVTNRDDGTLTIVDVATRSKIRDLEVGELPTSVTTSPLNNQVYVVNEGSGTVLVLDGTTHILKTVLTTDPGLTTLRFDVSGRWGFLLNTLKDELYIIDASADSVRYTFETGDQPDQIAFSGSFAYIRSRGTSDVGMIPLRELEQNRVASLEPFPAGRLAPGEFGGTGFADAIARAPDKHDGVYVPNPSEKTIYAYHFMEGMPTPSGSLNNYGFAPKAVLTVGMQLRESTPGVFSATTMAPRDGEYDLVFLLENPRIINCFDFTVDRNPEVEKNEPMRLRIAAVLGDDDVLAVGDDVPLRFRVEDVNAGEFLTDLGDEMSVLLMSPTGWQRRVPASKVADDTYEARVTLPRPGIYYLFIAAPELGIKFRDQRPATIQAARQ